MSEWVMIATQLLTLAVVFFKFSGRAEKREITPNPLNVRPDIPSHERFAAKSHDHPQYLLRDDCIQRHADDERRVKDQTTEIKGSIASLTAIINEHNANAEARARRLHERVEPLPPAIAAMTSVLENHLDDHRAGKA